MKKTEKPYKILKSKDFWDKLEEKFKKDVENRKILEKDVFWHNFFTIYPKKPKK